MRLVGIALSIVLLSLAVIFVGQVHSARADSPELVTTLHQGWNLVGWVDVETPVGQLFGDNGVPRLEAVRAWDSVEQSWLTAAPDGGGNLQTLTPGMGLWLSLSPGESFEWRRARGPYANSTMLREGENLVAWSALDAVPAAVGLRQIRDAATLIGAWNAEEQRWQMAAPHTPHSVWTLGQFNHGDAVWIEAADEIEWRQLTGESPRVTFIGDVSDEQRETTLAELELIRETFAAAFGGVSSAVDVLVFENRDVFQAWNKRHTGDASTPPCGNAAGSYIRYNLECGAGTLAHEYFHRLQWTTGHDRDRSSPYVWFSEGAAVLASFLFADSSHPGEFERLLRSAWTDATATDRNLSDPSNDYTIRYRGSAVAAYMLAQRSGSDALLRYLRDLYGSDDFRWQDADAVFAQTFSVSLTDFYREWEQATRSVPAVIKPLERQAIELVSTESPWRLDIDIRKPDGQAVDTPGRVSLLPGTGGSKAIGGWVFNGSTSIAALPGSYSPSRVRLDGCLLMWTTENRALKVSEQWALAPNQIHLRTGGCDSTISGIALSPDGSALDGPERVRVWILAYPEPWPSEGLPNPTAGAIPGPDGSFELSVPNGRYSVGVGPIETRSPGFGWYVPGGLSVHRGDRHVFAAPSDGTVKIDVMLPYGRRVNISGVVEGPGGGAAAGITVAPTGPHDGDPARSSGWIGWGDVTGEAGTFAIPFTGTHAALNLLSDGCLLGTWGPEGFRPTGQGASYWEVNDRDISDLVIRLPRTTCG